jgi:hypothetical protein
MNRLRTSSDSWTNAIWSLTLVLTLVSALLASQDNLGSRLTTSTAETMAVLALAAGKVLCIIWNFMEIRAAPRWLRHCTLVWVASLWLTIVAIYLY